LGQEASRGQGFNGRISMNHSKRLLCFTCQRNTVLLTLATELDESARDIVDEETESMLRLVSEPAAAAFVVDFEGRPRFRAGGLLMLLGVLSKYAKAASGKLLICNPSAQDMATLKRLRLDRVWPVYNTREEALATLEAQGTAMAEA